MNRRIGKLLRELRYYPRFRDKFLSLYNVLLVSRKLRGLPLPWRRKAIEVFLKDHSHPFAVRLGSTDWLVLVEIFLDGEYSEVREFLADSPPASIIDIGSNAGFSVRYWLEHFPEARLIAVEPDSDNFAMLERNIALGKHAISPILVQACIVGQPRDHVFLERQSGREWAFAISATKSATTQIVNAITLDQLKAQSSLVGNIGLLKCDIEGGEAELFEHCGSWIKRVEMAVVEVHGDFTKDNLLSLLKDRGVVISPYSSKKSDICIFRSERAIN